MHNLLQILSKSKASLQQAASYFCLSIYHQKFFAGMQKYSFNKYKGFNLGWEERTRNCIRMHFDNRWMICISIINNFSALWWLRISHYVLIRLIPYYIWNSQINCIFLQDWIFDICIWWLPQVILHRYLNLRRWWKCFCKLSYRFFKRHIQNFCNQANPSFPLSKCLKNIFASCTKLQISSEMKFWNQFTDKWTYLYCI